MKTYAQIVKDSLIVKNPSPTIKKKKTYSDVLKESISHADTKYEDYYIHFNCFICKDIGCQYCYNPYFEIQERYFFDKILVCDGFIEYSEQGNTYCTCVNEIFEGNISFLSEEINDAFGIATWIDKNESIHFRYYHVHFNSFTGQYMRHDYNDTVRPKDWRLVSLSLLHYPLFHFLARDFISQ